MIEALLSVPADRLAELVADSEQDGWRFVRRLIFFIFKLADGTVRELAFLGATQSEIAHLCSSLNKDPIEKTSDMPRYLAGNPFYRELVAAFHAGRVA
jgi:hypothetical protein